MQLNVKTQRLARVAPLAVLESEAVRLLAFDGEEVTLEPQAVLFRQGDTADSGYAVLSGAVALEREAEIPTPVRLMGAGSLIGVNALIVEGERPTSATAREKSLLIKLPRRLMLRVLEAFPDSALAFKNYVEGSIAEQASALGRVADAIDAVARSYAKAR
ncbi:Cyclic nucleotide-binding domain-containing protein [Rhizobiales bacterium GAS191]|jgi:CRP-like cAMP-binding protein|nr:Cyclic nucleotide-binding domain-containing protein [Rhizobiales bacterium GAS113]SEC62182.1 Cyclic nucleotide-binding domain-containing protein [Rhizobiales bacterium GAS188]SEC66722.1 Cyclic nucleotide-binding domain-containing protein [Rhizobiales bacterium GAS191]